jgi:DNA polymerase III epsilon subunit-like protein
VFILFDTETTGIGEGDRVCQVAIGLMEADGTRYISEYCQPPVAMSIHAMSVHGITPEKLQDKPTFEKLDSYRILQEMNEAGNVLVAHNASFDIDMIKKEGIEWQGGVIDTLRCAKHLLPNEESHALQYLRYSLSLYKEEGCEEELELRAKFDTFSAHDALFDIYVLKKLLKKLFILAGSAQKLLELSKTPVMVNTIRFGKYKNMTFEEIAKKDLDYLKWLSKNTEDDDIRYTASSFLK